MGGGTLTIEWKLVTCSKNCRKQEQQSNRTIIVAITSLLYKQNQPNNNNRNKNPAPKKRLFDVAVQQHPLNCGELQKWPSQLGTGRVIPGSRAGVNQTRNVNCLVRLVRALDRSFDWVEIGLRAKVALNDSLHESVDQRWVSRICDTRRLRTETARRRGERDYLS